MKKRLVLYDAEAFDGLPPSSQDTLLFPAAPPVKHCTGCFGCWVKTPGRCVINDRCADLPVLIAQCEELVFVSPILYGGFSVNLKKLLERSIGYLLPYERMVNGEMHHKIRYKNPFQLTVYFYGPCGEDERAIAKRLVAANAINFGAGGHTVHFVAAAEDAKEALF